ncbi:MAG: twin-arginine translocase TatA/TatE family subunit [Acidobacteriota bacterium]|nr:twin-arginine translocase TatA/TatE family subunit [Acidobacteriota bacterium]
MGTPPFIEVASIGMADSLILMVLALVVFGPRRLPQIGRQIGKLMYEFRKASNDFKFQMEEELRNAEEADRRKREEAERERTLALAPPEQMAETSSQVTEDGYGASSDTEGASTESSYPYATEYAEAPTPEDEAAAPEVEESYPRIQPPSTGETVAAERPGSAVAAVTETAEASEQAASTEAVSESAGFTVGEDAAGASLEPLAAVAKKTAPVAKRTRRKKKEAVVEQTNAATEPATHNG